MNEPVRGQRRHKRTARAAAAGGSAAVRPATPPARSAGVEQPDRGEDGRGEAGDATPRGGHGYRLPSAGGRAARHHGGEAQVVQHLHGSALPTRCQEEEGGGGSVEVKFAAFPLSPLPSPRMGRDRDLHCDGRVDLPHLGEVEHLGRRSTAALRQRGGVVLCVVFVFVITPACLIWMVVVIVVKTPARGVPPHQRSCDGEESVPHGHDRDGPPAGEAESVGSLVGPWGRKGVGRVEPHGRGEGLSQPGEPDPRGRLGGGEGAIGPSGGHVAEGEVMRQRRRLMLLQLRGRPVRGRRGRRRGGGGVQGVVGQGGRHGRGRLGGGRLKTADPAAKT